ncbi:MAG: proline--tRNA ligase, partial [Gemmatimonadetes bacterium]|nr:proline--tRNA ligase [Gemmatimonadota bacterium]
QALAELPGRLDAFQQDLLDAARKYREENSYRGVTEFGELKEIIEGEGGFVYTGWNGDPKVEQWVKEEIKATTRVIPDAEFASEEPPTKCISGDDAKVEVVWSRAY